MSSHRGFRVLHEHVEIAVPIEDARVDQLKLRVRLGPPAVFLDQARVGKFRLRIFVQHLHVGVRRRGVEIEVILLHVFAVVAFVAVEPEEALLQDGIAAIPQRQREADALVPVADAADAVFAPAVGARARVVVREILPRGAVRAVILAHGSPLALAEVGPPALPMDFALLRFQQSFFFARHGRAILPDRAHRSSTRARSARAMRRMHEWIARLLLDGTSPLSLSCLRVHAGNASATAKLIATVKRARPRLRGDRLLQRRRHRRAQPGRLRPPVLSRFRADHRRRRLAGRLPPDARALGAAICFIPSSTSATRISAFARRAS